MANPKESTNTAMSPDTSPTAVECLWTDWSFPVHHVVSSESLPNLLGSVGKHLALGIYELKHNLVATAGTLHVMVESNEDIHSGENIKLALTFATNPSILDTIPIAEKEILIGMKLLFLNPALESYETTPFPALYQTDCFDPVSDLIIIQLPAEAPEDPLVTFMKQNPSYVPTYPEQKRLHPIQTEESENPRFVGVGWLNTRASVSKTNESWLGISGGRGVGQRGGAKSRIHWMVVEICRQVYRGYYKVGSISSFAGDVLMIVDCDREEREINALVNNIVSGGQPQDRLIMEWLESRHLLS